MNTRIKSNHNPTCKTVRIHTSKTEHEVHDPQGGRAWLLLPCPHAFFANNDGSSSAACLHQRCDGMCSRGATGRRSLAAEYMKMGMQTPTAATAIMTVFPRQFVGLHHQPPAGLHTCFGYG
eukprot:m.165497 g.165497  ORF g.165497 m.165497 type:complete len:121 (+) comp12568_c0_seq1:89-451(+)